MRFITIYVVVKPKCAVGKVTCTLRSAEILAKMMIYVPITSRDVPEAIFLPDTGYRGGFFTGSGTSYQVFNKLEEQHKLR